MSKSPSIPSQLWEQWLQRLHGIEEPQKNYYRLELLQLLVKAEQLDKDRFLNRFGTILCRSLHSGSVYIFDKKNKEFLYGESSANEQDAQKKVANLLSTKNNGLSIKQFPRGKKILNGKGPIKSLCELLLPLFPDNQIYLVVLSPENQTNEDRQFLHFVAGLLGLFEKKISLSRELAQEQRLLELLTQHINEGLVLFSKDRRIKVWNRPLQRITGYSPKEAREKTVTEVLSVYDQPNWLDELIESYRESKQNGFILECQVMTKAKLPRWISISGSFLRDNLDEIEQTIALVRDISHEKALEQRKNEFISIATHELRTPITAIKGYLSLLQSTADTFSPKQHQYLQNANIATERLVKLAEDLLQVIRLDEDRMKFNLQPVELTKIIEKVAGDFSEKARKKGLEFRLTLPPFNTMVIADPIRLEQVFANLIDNAIKYTTRGSVSIAFEHYSEKTTKEDKVAVIVKDTGIGIDNKDLTGIFEKFHRSDRVANLREPGAGLGLYIVKSFIEKQNGQISVKSRFKRGSIFAVTFPTISVIPHELDRKPTLAEEKIRSSMGRAK